MAFEARRKGLNVYALPFSDKRDSASYQLGERFQDAWINPKTGKTLQSTVLRGKTDDDVITKLRKQLSQPGEYVLGLNPKTGVGHVVNVINV